MAFALNDPSARIGTEPMEALLGGPREALEAALADAKGRFIHGFKVATDRGPGQLESIEFPDAAQVLTWRDTVKPMLPVVLPVNVTGRLPAGATWVTFQFAKVLTEVILTVEVPHDEPLADAVEAGAPSTPFPLALAASSSPPGPPASPPAPPASARASLAPPTATGRDDDHRTWYALAAGLALLAGVFWAFRRAFPGRGSH